MGHPCSCTAEAPCWTKKRPVAMRFKEALDSFKKSKKKIDSMCDERGQKKNRVDYNDFCEADITYRADKYWVLGMLEEAVGKGMDVVLVKKKGG